MKIEGELRASFSRRTIGGLKRSDLKSRNHWDWRKVIVEIYFTCQKEKRDFCYAPQAEYCCQEVKQPILKRISKKQWPSFLRFYTLQKRNRIKDLYSIAGSKQVVFFSNSSYLYTLCKKNKYLLKYRCHNQRTKILKSRKFETKNINNLMRLNTICLVNPITRRLI